MPTSPTAIYDYLLRQPQPPPLAFREAGADTLHNLIYELGGEPLYTKTPARGIHQLQGLAFALWAVRSLLFFQMRTGKTWIALNWLSYLIYTRQITSKALVIVHAPIGAEEWASQITQHSHLDASIIRSGRDAHQRFELALCSDTMVIVVAWPTLQQIFSVKRVVQQGSKKGAEKLYVDHSACRAAAPLLEACVVDEIHMAGNSETLRFQIATELTANCLWRLGLTGTPFGRDPLLLWAEAYLADKGQALGRSFRFFRSAFCDAKWNPFARSYNDFKFDSRKLPLLRTKMSAMSLHCALHEVQDVNVLNGVIRLAMSHEQMQAYSEAVDRLVQLAIGNAVEIDNIFVRLRQIATGYLPFIDEAGNERIVDFPDAAKFVWLEDFISDLPELKIVIFHEFIHSGERIVKLLKKHRIKCEWLYGGSKDRQQLLDNFRHGDAQILVANAATGGMSIDLSVADYMIFLESPVSVLVRRQAEARPLARGNRPLVVDDMVCAPVEQKLLDFIAQGAGLRDALLRDPRTLAEQLR